MSTSDSPFDPIEDAIAAIGRGEITSVRPLGTDIRIDLRPLVPEGAVA